MANKKLYEDMPSYVRDFLNYMEVVKGKSQTTTKEYYFDLRTFLRYLKSESQTENYSVEELASLDVSDVSIDTIRKLTLSDLYEYMAYVNRGRKNAAATRARKVSCLKSFFKYLNVKAGLLDSDPAKELDTPKMKKSLPKYLTLDESRRLLDVVNGPFASRDYAMLILFLNCGLRLSELVGIDLCDLRGDTLSVVGKGNKERTIYLNAACKKALEGYLKDRPRDGVKDRKALFLSSRKTRISNKTVQYIVKKYITLAGLDPAKFSVHKLRHTAATLMYQYGDVDIRLLQEILGHENLSTTEIYTHIDSRQLKAAVDKNPLAQMEPAHLSAEDQENK